MSIDQYHEKIQAQPDLTDRLISSIIDSEFPVQFDVNETLEDIDEIIIVASGSARNASEYGARLLRSLAGYLVRVHPASEFTRDTPVSKQPVIVGVTRSGETASTISALRDAGDRGYRTLAVTSARESSATEISDAAILWPEDEEIDIGEPSTFPTISIVLGLLAINLGSNRPKISTKGGDSIRRELRAVPEMIESVLKQEDTIQSVATQYADCDRFFYVGTAGGIPSAHEGATKLERLAGKFAKSVPAGEMKHGSLPLVSEETPVLTQFTDSTISQQSRANVRELRARGAPTIGLVCESCQDGDLTDEYLTEKLPIPWTGLFAPIPTAVCWQLFAYHVASN